MILTRSGPIRANLRRALPESFGNRVSHTRESFGDEQISQHRVALTCDNQDGVMFRIPSGPFEVEPDSSQRDSRRNAKGSLRRTSYN